MERLLPIVAAPARWRLAPLLQTLAPDEVDRLLGSFPINLPPRRRCYALVRCAVDLGLRSSEVIALALDTLNDVDLQTAALTVRQTKFHMSCCLPLHPSAVRELDLYRQAPDTCHSTDASSPFFASHDGGHLPKWTVENVSLRLQRRLSWRARGDHPHSRIHDLRHTFAVRRAQHWRETGHPSIMRCSGYARTSGMPRSSTPTGTCLAYQS